MDMHWFQTNEIRRYRQGNKKIKIIQGRLNMTDQEMLNQISKAKMLGLEIQEIEITNLYIKKKYYVIFS